MTKTQQMDIAYIHECLAYSAATGEFTWKRRPVEHFATKRAFGIWNTRYAGKRAGTTGNNNGYCTISVDSTRFRAARLAWALTYGVWPDNVDHINHDGEDDRLENLRDVTTAQNQKNLPMRRDNTSGQPGVVWSKRQNDWLVRVGDVYVGRAKQFEQAVRLRKLAERKHNYHLNTGKAKGVEQ